MGFDATRKSLESAAGTAEVIGIAYGAFARMLPKLRAMTDPSSELFSAAVMAAALAANGRDALAFTPSLAIGNDEGDGLSVQDPGQDLGSARDIASLCQLLASRLDQAAEAATQDRDQAACQQAAQCAYEMAALLSGGS